MLNTFATVTLDLPNKPLLQQTNLLRTLNRCELYQPDFYKIRYLTAVWSGMLFPKSKLLSIKTHF